MGVKHPLFVALKMLPSFSVGVLFCLLVDQFVALVKDQEGFVFMYDMVSGGPTRMVGHGLPPWSPF